VDPARYDRTRPRYPDAMVERIVAASPGPDVLDVGCGTGIEARQFQAAGCKVLGVEPDAPRRRMCCGLVAAWRCSGTCSSPRPDMAEAFVAVYRRVMPDSPFNLRAATEQGLDVYQVMFTKAADGVREGRVQRPGAAAIRRR
jgi:SAM-dependent methyltransferase